MRAPVSETLSPMHMTFAAFYLHTYYLLTEFQFIFFHFMFAVTIRPAAVKIAYRLYFRQ